ncbi:hypothetical protein [Zhaonella formicivorans]|uniref:hypothetical protein n=1 Tax=Zhaonella formicivorans TaxID=2528593 RepID=UPI0010D562CF|nr:hypothetical protein [Zhaonella formicivorans]
MRFKVVFLVAVLCLLLLLPEAVAEGDVIGLVFQGRLTELSGRVEKGVAMVDLEELVRFLQAKIITRDQHQITLLSGKSQVRLSIIPKGREKQLVLLRSLGEQLAEKIIWEGKTKTVLFAEREEASLSEKDYDLLNRLLADDWMRAENKVELYKYFAPLLAGELLEQVTENSWEFVSQPTDWDARYFLGGVKPVAAGESWRAVLAEIIEQSEGSRERVGRGLFIFTRQSDGEWRITAMRYNWPQDKP